MENLSIDSTSVKVHESSNGGEKTENKAVGRSRGGLNTKLHAIVDGLGNPVEFLLSALLSLFWSFSTRNAFFQTSPNETGVFSSFCSAR